MVKVKQLLWLVNAQTTQSTIMALRLTHLPLVETVIIQVLQATTKPQAQVLAQHLTTDHSMKTSMVGLEFHK
jgi:hypothetical protein